MKLAAPSTACAGLECAATGFDCVCAAPSTPLFVDVDGDGVDAGVPVLDEVFVAADTPALPDVFETPAVFAEADCEVELDVEVLVQEPAPWDFSACTST